jgi:NADH dehydrogenase (ubiquinone) 1 beta subcomplex subunit 9
MEEAHRKLVVGLYRRCLRAVVDWNVNYFRVRRLSVAIRQRFDKHKNETDKQKVQELVDLTQRILYDWRHPDPFTCKTPV